MALFSEEFGATWYGGGCYPNVEFDPVNNHWVYLVSDVAGIWKSNDLGDHWEFINEGLNNRTVALIAVARSDRQILYAGTKGGLYISHDAGKNWALCSRYDGRMSFVRPENYRSIAIDSQDPGNVFAGTAAGQVLRSGDFGSHWKGLGGKEEPFESGWPVTSLALVEGQCLFAGSQNGLMKFSFADNFWQKIENGPDTVLDLYYLAPQLSSSENSSSPSPLPLQGGEDKGEGAKFLPNSALGGKAPALFAAGKERLFLSRDLGVTWEQSAPVPQGKTQRVSAYQTEDGNIHLAVAWKKGGPGGVLVSHDLGKTWISTDRQMHEDAAADPTRAWMRGGGKTTAIKISPTDLKVMFRTDWWGVWRSDDGGLSWNEKIIGAPNTVGSDISIDSKGQIYVATMDNGLLKSGDGGKTYQALFPSKGYDPGINGHVWRVLTSQDGKKIVATSSPWDKHVNQVALSNDGGQSFSIAREGLPLKRPKQNTMWGEGYPRALAQDPRNPDMIYLGIDGDDGGGLFISRDGGKTWKLSPGQPGSRRVYNALAVDPADPERIFWGACGKGGGVYVSEDGGLSWTRVLSEMAWVFDLAVSPNGTVYAGGDNMGPELYASENQGKKWKLLKAFDGKGTVEAITIDPKDPKRIAISTVQWSSGSGGTIYLTADGGKHWENITRDLPPGKGAAAMAFSQDGYLYITRYAGSVYRMKLSRETTD